MRYYLRLPVEKLLLVVCVALVRVVVPAAIGHSSDDAYQSLALNQGLYNASDDVFILNFTNFKHYVHGSEHAWLVEFYNSWCGFCQHFAPTWKAFARDVYGWRGIVTVAALDCADDDNNQLCRKHEIMHYPLIRYFEPHSKPTNIGMDVEKGKDVETLRRNLIFRLRKEQQEGRGSKWPNITRFRSGELKNIWEGIPSAARYYFFLFEEVEASLGSEVILDFRNVPSLVIRSVTTDNSLLCIMLKITRFPSLIVYSRDGKHTRLTIRVPTREETRNVIMKFLKSKKIDVEIEDKPERKEESQNQIPPNFTSEKAPPDVPKSEPKETEDYLYQADLEASLRYAIGHEIPMIKMIEGERMKALKNFTSVLSSYFPLKRGNPMFLSTIAFVTRAKESISGEDFGALVVSTERDLSPVYSEANQWIGCKPSKPGFRGYTCGLWSLFHTLTVNFAVRSMSHTDLDPTQVLRAIHGYVKNFFGCSECSDHFLAMSSKNKIFEVSSPDDSVLWLWRAHNEVNLRLAGQDTEDPEHPKIQYPSKKNCPACRDENNDWNVTEVLFYLKRKYSYSGIQYTGTPKSVSTFEPKSTPRVERPDSDSKRIPVKKFGWDFTIFDISICVVLYITSAAILILVCIKFAVKRSYKKRMYVHSILLEKFKR